ncbi:MAG TPA: DUF4388 domain-containing protein [Kofleriaceae bacterium]|nr:DUF4388 domain-containing protein [Kofleriaceae bacterium]
MKGSITDRPWGMTLGAIALRRHTGQLTIDSDGKRYCIAFADGALVAATSPVAADGIARIALTNHFITSTQVADLARRLALSPERDEVMVLAEAMGFSSEQVVKLRRKLVAQRAARTFSLERGEFVLDDVVTLPVFPEVAVDHRHAIYLGARTNLAEQRLIDDLRQLGAYFVLKPDAIDDLPRYGFEPGAQPVLEALKLGTSLPELEASHREIDPRFAQAIIYALVSCTACVVSMRAAPPQLGVVRTTTVPRTRGVARTTTGANRPGAPSVPSASRSPTPSRADARTPTSPFTPRAPTASPTAYSTTAVHDGTNTPAALRPRVQPDTAAPLANGRSEAPPAEGRAHTPAPSAGRARTPTPPVGGTPSAGPTLAPIAALPLRSAARPTPAPGTPVAVAEPPDGAPSTARTDTEESVPFPEAPTPPPAPTRRARTIETFGAPQLPRAGSRSTSPGGRPAIARTPTPSDADIRGFTDQRTPTGAGSFGDQRTPSYGDQRTPGFTDQRTPTGGTSGPISARVSTDNAAAAEVAFKRGELAMKRDQPGEAILEYKAALDLNPNDVDYAGMLAWAKFCAAGDKAAIAVDTRKTLERAVFKSHRPERARFYLGRVERMLGRDKEALRHFLEVLELKPNHADAASEVRAIEARMQAAKGGTGLFGRKR